MKKQAKFYVIANFFVLLITQNFFSEYLPWILICDDNMREITNVFSKSISFIRPNI